MPSRNGDVHCILGNMGWNASLGNKPTGYRTYMVVDIKHGNALKSGKPTACRFGVTGGALADNQF